VASQQLSIGIPAAITQAPHSAAANGLAFNEANDLIEVKGADFSLEFNKKKGTFSKIEKGGENLLQEGGGPMLHLWRAPHQKDDMWAYQGWERNGLQSIGWTVDSIQDTKLASGDVEIKVRLTGTGKNNFVVRHNAVYTISPSGDIAVTNDVNFSDPKLVLARIGVRIFLNKDLDHFEYYGRGPMENYSDRKSGFDVGLYSSSVLKQMTPYEKPMECGNHEDVRWARLTSPRGLGLNIQESDSLLQVSALPYSDEEMDPVEYKIDLPKSKGTVLCVSHKTLGVGSNGCGPRPLEPHKVYATPSSFSYRIQLIR
jgi:beta-galactosidase